MPNSYLLLKDKFNEMVILWVDMALLCEYKWEDDRMDELDDAMYGSVVGLLLLSEPNPLVELFAAFAFAHRRSLGFNPTAMHAPGDLIQFIIMVHPHDSKKPWRFHTRKIVSSFGVEPLQGIKVNEGGKEKGDPLVLKDIWVDQDY
ncbi:hypothetical protein BS47DRAFT_1362784 [Hydnum rufescens UP504]|uniref:Uncharacterized protein n=1 Tax=Hydnum rufescens UP504 TaxID=1448309 RepID=A0A9P6AX69_9AGAM|nr:hypothetical protein BS47DRAFT_1362784 [Hydnum rufescens UP504]